LITVPNLHFQIQLQKALPLILIRLTSALEWYAHPGSEVVTGKYADRVKIVARTACSWTITQDIKVAPVTLTPFGDIMKLSFQDSKKYAGILTLPALCKLQEECTIEYAANMVAFESRRDQKSVKRHPTPRTTVRSELLCMELNPRNLP
jgi:hypothetical protein